jgi:ABC-type Na+ efflux pump permease subunit
MQMFGWGNNQAEVKNYQKKLKNKMRLGEHAEPHVTLLVMSFGGLLFFMVVSFVVALLSRCCFKKP